MWRALSILLLILLVGASAHAQSAADVAAARDLFREAAQLSREGKWEEAKNKLKRSLALKPAPITHFSLAVAQQKTGEFVEALENFRAFLISPPEPSTDKYRTPAQQAVTELEPRVARVSIAVRPPALEGLTIKIDGHAVPLAALEQPRLVNPGAHEVKASAPGHHDATQRFEVAEGGSAEVTLTLKPAPEAPAPVAPPPAEPTPEVKERPFPIAPVVLIAVGAAAIGVGVAVGMIGLNEAKEAPTNDGEEAQAARTKGIAGDVVAGVGGLAAGIGVILLIVHFVVDDESVGMSPGGLRVSF